MAKRTNSKKKSPPRVGRARNSRQAKPLFASLSTPVVETRYLEVQAGPKPKITEVRPRGSGTNRDEWRNHYVTLQLEWTNCGKCPKAHGPYWFAYKRGPDRWPDKGKLLKVYVGKSRNDAKAVANLKDKGAF